MRDNASLGPVEDVGITGLDGRLFGALVTDDLVPWPKREGQKGGAEGAALQKEFTACIFAIHFALAV